MARERFDDRTYSFERFRSECMIALFVNRGFSALYEHNFPTDRSWRTKSFVICQWRLTPLIEDAVAFHAHQDLDEL
jgi:hypothetical protein